jgi:hypothetical protein
MVLHGKVIIPDVPAGMEENGHVAALRVDARQIGSFVQVAVAAG